MKLLIDLLLLFSFATSVAAIEIRVSLGERIQEAIDNASAGDVIKVEGGTYQETGNGWYGLWINKDNITLEGEGEVRVLQNEDQVTGIYASPLGCNFNDTAGSCASEIFNYKIANFTAEGFMGNGIQTRWVNGFEAHYCKSINNCRNGLYWTLSSNGLVSHCYSSGSILDSAMWIAGSQNVIADYNELTYAPTGLEVTVSNDVWARNNYIHNNTVGVGLYHPGAAGKSPLNFSCSNSNLPLMRLLFEQETLRYRR